MVRKLEFYVRVDSPQWLLQSHFCVCLWWQTRGVSPFKVALLVDALTATKEQHLVDTFNSDVQACGRKIKHSVTHAIYAGQQKHIHREDSKPPGKVLQCHM